MNRENVLDETYRKAGKLDSECFSPMLDLRHTDLMKIIRDYLLEGTQLTKGIKTELYKLNVYGMHLSNLHSPPFDTMLLPRSRVILQASRRYSTQR
jgi:hypothetical protein